MSLAAAAALLVALAPATQAKPPGGDLTEAQQRSLAAGIQVAPKGSANAKSAMKAPNPYLANLPDAKTADYSSWKQRMTAAGKQRAKSAALAANRTRAAGRALSAPFVHDEQEPTDDNGSNDSQANAEPVSGFGTGARQNPRVRILGSIADLTPDSEAIEARPEDNGAIGLATDTGIDGAGAITTESFLGDGPHGGPSGSNDFDFYALTSLAGLSIIVDTTQTPGFLDTVVAIYDESGELLAENDDAYVEPNFLASRLNFPVTETGRYFVLVAGFSGNGSLPTDPFDSGSGAGGADEGDYALSISSAATDTDYFAVRLKKGDVIGAVGKGVASTLTIWRPDGTQMVGSPGIDLSFLYAPESPLPGGGNTTLAYVAERTGSYAIQVDGAPGSYDTLVEAYRPGSEIDRASRVQTIFLDFDGARVNTGIFGGPGVRDLSPFGAFLGRWDLPRAQQATMINKITAGVRENVRRDLIARGSNPNVAVQVINSKDDADSFGKPNVSRVIVGGTIEESGIPTIGVAQTIDPGNYGHEDSALVLLDVLSGPPDDEASLNHYLRPGSNRADFVATAVANVISHEIGHTIGSYHTDESNDVHHLVDAGGANFGANLYGVGPDGIGGTADDEDIDFGTDTYSLFEGYTGQQNSLNVAAWAFVRNGVVAQP